MNKFPFVSDLVLLVARDEVPSKDLLREVAQHLDYLVLVPDALDAYAVAVLSRLAPLHVKIRRDSGGQRKDLNDLPYLREPDAEHLDDIVSQPFSSRSDDWLREHNVDLIALNLPALEEIQERVLEEAPPAWVALFDDESWLRHFELSFMATDVDVFSPRGVELPDRGLLAGATRDEGDSVEAASHGPIESLHTVSITDAASVESPGNVPGDTATFHIQLAGRSLKVRSGGVAFVDTGCTLTLRWFKLDGRSINGARAEATVRDRDEVVEIWGDSEAVVGQWLEFEFRRTGHRPYAVRGRFKI